MKVFFSRLLLMVLAVVCVLGAVEVAFRVTGYDPHALDAYAPWYDRSHARYLAAPAREHPWAAGHPNPLRIAVIGDSITDGSGVQPEDAYPGRLERYLNLNRATRPARVDVFAEGGASTDYQLRFLPDALAAGADVVVLGICLNDTEDMHRPEEYKGWRQEAVPRVPGGWAGAMVRRSRLLHWLNLKREFLRTRRAHLAYYRRIYDPAYSGWKRFEEALGAFRRQCRDAGVPLVALVFPMLSWDMGRDTYPLRFAQDAVLGVLSDSGIPAVDLLRTFEGKASVRLEVIPKIDGHPNEIAHRMAADTLFRFLLEEGILDSAYIPEHAQGQEAYWEAMRKRMRGIE